MSSDLREWRGVIRREHRDEYVELYKGHRPGRLSRYAGQSRRSHRGARPG